MLVEQVVARGKSELQHTLQLMSILLGIVRAEHYDVLLRLVLDRALSVVQRNGLDVGGANGIQ